MDGRRKEGGMDGWVEECKYEMRQQEELTPRCLVWVPGEMMVSASENGKQKPEASLKAIN